MKKIYTLVIALLAASTGMAQTTLANFDFNNGASFPIAPASSASNITANFNGTEADAGYNGTATGTSAFIQNITAGSSLSMSANDNTNNWILTLGGSNLSQYLNYNLYFQAEHSPTGAVNLALAWSTDGITYTALSQTVALGASNTFIEDLVSLSSITQLNGASNIYIKFSPSGATGNSGTIRIDNLQIQAATSPWTQNGGNVDFSGGVTASTFTATGDALIEGSLTGNNITANTLSTTGNLSAGILNVAGSSSLNGNTSVVGALTTSSLSVSSLSGGSSDYNEVFVDANGNLKQVLPVIGTPLPNCGNGNPAWRLGGNSIGSYQNAVFGTCDKDLTFEAGGYHAMFLTTTGYLGIGNSVPNAMLDIIPAGSTAAFNVGNSTGTSLFNITSNGKVGIGNANPTAILDIATSGTNAGFNVSNGDLGVNLFSISNIGDVTITSNLIANGNITAPAIPVGTGGTGYFGLLIDGGGNIVKSNVSILNSTTAWNLGGNGTHLGAVASSIGTTDANDLPIVTNNIERIHITASGKVGIGTISPDASSLLDIEGVVKIADGTQGNGKILTSDANGLSSWQNAQQLSINGGIISLTNGGSVTLPIPTGDNMGNCVATTDINMQSHEINYVSDIHFNAGSIGGISFGNLALLEPVFIGGNYGIGTSAGADFEVGQDLTVTGGTTIEGGAGLKVESGSTEVQDLSVNSSSTFNDDVTISGSSSDLTVGGKITATGAVSGAGGSFSSLVVGGINFTAAQGVEVDDDGMGDLTVAGTIWTTSDARYKKNIKTIESPLQKLLNLRGTSYEYNREAFPKMNFSKQKTMGFIAQELKEVFPEAVKQMKNGYYTVNYQAIIPVLVEAIKEQQKTIDSLHGNSSKQDSINNALQNQLNQLATVINSCCSMNASGKVGASIQNIELNDKDVVVLNQNVPNPFAEQTAITYNISQNAGAAQLLFYDALGRQIKTVDITTKGAGQLNVYANDLTNGIYSYTLIVDGNIVATKKMVKQQ